MCRIHTVIVECLQNISISFDQHVSLNACICVSAQKNIRYARFNTSDWRWWRKSQLTMCMGSISWRAICFIKWLSYDLTLPKKRRNLEEKWNNKLYMHARVTDWVALWQKNQCYSIWIHTTHCEFGIREKTRIKEVGVMPIERKVLE